MACFIRYIMLSEILQFYFCCQLFVGKIKVAICAIVLNGSLLQHISDAFHKTERALLTSAICQMLCMTAFCVNT